MIVNKQKQDTDKPVAQAVDTTLELAENMYGFLAKAASIAAEAGVAPEVFTSAAWQAYIAASPELAERLAEKQFEETLEELRKSGRMAKA